MNGKSLNYKRKQFSWACKNEHLQQTVQQTIGLTKTAGQQLGFKAVACYISRMCARPLFFSRHFFSILKATARFPPFYESFGRLKLIL